MESGTGTSFIGEAIIIESFERNPDKVWDDQYYDEMYAISTDLFDQSESAMDMAEQWDERGDYLQLVMMIMALGLAFAAWASLLKEESKMRLLFAIFSVIMLVYGLLAYLSVPSIA